MVKVSKVSLSVTVDNELISLLEGKQNKSETINQILKRALRTEEGIKTEIEYHKNQIELLNKELEQLITRNKEKIENIPDNLKHKLFSIKRILEYHPDKIYVWTEIVNKNYNQNLNCGELKKMIEKWC